ncbi:hypothetical protein BG005_007483 [Podila minutissima]|nr:hypothetical protein BG005_007483 [Podila minutissima]
MSETNIATVSISAVSSVTAIGDAPPSLATEAKPKASTLSIASASTPSDASQTTPPPATVLLPAADIKESTSSTSKPPKPTISKPTYHYKALDTDLKGKAYNHHKDSSRHHFCKFYNHQNKASDSNYFERSLNHFFKHFLSNYPNSASHRNHHYNPSHHNHHYNPSDNHNHDNCKPS